MAELKTKRNNDNPLKFIKSVENEQRRKDALKLLELFPAWTNLQPQMWGGSIIGYGKTSYTTADGKEHDWMATGFSPRKQALTLYIMSGFGGYDELLKKLGPHKIGKSCLYIKKLSDIDEDILKKLVQKSVESITKKGAFNDYVC